jgi:hypothetical protein
MQIEDMFWPYKTILRYNCYTVLKYYVAHVAPTAVSLLLKILDFQNNKLV